MERDGRGRATRALACAERTDSDSAMAAICVPCGYSNSWRGVAGPCTCPAGSPDLANYGGPGGGSGGLAVLLNPETNNGYYFEIIALTEDNITPYLKLNKEKMKKKNHIHSPSKSVIFCDGDFELILLNIFALHII